MARRFIAPPSGQESTPDLRGNNKPHSGTECGFSLYLRDYFFMPDMSSFFMPDMSSPDFIMPFFIFFFFIILAWAFIGLLVFIASWPGWPVVWANAVEIPPMKTVQRAPQTVAIIALRMLYLQRNDHARQRLQRMIVPKSALDRK